MNDDELKREIEEALAIEPSPHFAARVRTHIANTPASSSSWLRWGVAAAALTSAAIVVAVALMPSKPRTVATTQVPPPAALAPVPAPPPAPQPPAEVVAKHVAPAKPKAVEPEVLFDPREIVAFQTFMQGVRDDRIDISKLASLQKEAETRKPIEEIALMPLETLEPIVIEPLTAVARSKEGGTL